MLQILNSASSYGRAQDGVTLLEVVFTAKKKGANLHGKQICFTGSLSNKDEKIHVLLVDNDTMTMKSGILQRFLNVFSLCSANFLTGIETMTFSFTGNTENKGLQYHFLFSTFIFL